MKIVGAVNEFAESIQNLPEPDADAKAHSERLRVHIAAAISKAGGWISFAEFMEYALYAPGLGYYSAGATVFGEEGDFITAPELSPLFARCLARQCAEILDAFDEARVLEFGAGSGRMAADMLLEFERLGALPERYMILERSADFRTRQQQTLGNLAGELAERVVWLDQLPDSFDGVVVANEVLDALPFERFRIDGSEDNAIRRLGVSVHGDKFVWADKAAPDYLVEAVRGIEDDIAKLPHGYTSEVCLHISPWIASVSAVLERGALFLIDYGLPRCSLYLPERSNGTLICHYRHRAHDHPFRYVGLQDITAWVDFSAVAEAADDAFLELAGFTTQANFLIGCGMSNVFNEAVTGHEPQRIKLAGEVKRLMLPGEMGERFKAIAFTRGVTGALSGFSVRDLRDSL